MKQLATILYILLVMVPSINAQDDDVSGAAARNFELQDINGDSHNLYQVLAEGKTVFIDFMTTWCGPCWSFHEAGVFKDLYNSYGPDGTDEIRIFMIEIDQETTIEQLNGIGSGTAGDYVTGTPYPIIDNSPMGPSYKVHYIPTLYKICPDRIVEKVERLEVEDYYAMVGECPSIDTAPEPLFTTNDNYGCGSASIQFDDDSWPSAESWNWDFGDGESSQENSPLHTYNSPGTYDVTLRVSNGYGESEKVFESIIVIDDGTGEQEIESVGHPLSDGPYRGHGNRGLFFDVMSPVVIESVVVETQSAAEREFVIWDENNVIIATRKVWIEEGPSTVQLDIQVPPGQQYLLTCKSDANMRYTNTGVSFPYEIDGLVSITRSFTAIAPDTEYYFFYDWSVRPAGCGESVSTDETDNSDLTLYPNPVTSELYVSGLQSGKGKMSIHHLTGAPLNAPITHIQKDIYQIELSQVPTGIYLLKYGNVVHKVVKQ